MDSLSSPYIVEVYRYENDTNEYIMEFMDLTLDEYIKKTMRSSHEVIENQL